MIIHFAANRPRLVKVRHTPNWRVNSGPIDKNEKLTVPPNDKDNYIAKQIRRRRLATHARYGHCFGASHQLKSVKFEISQFYISYKIDVNRKAFGLWISYTLCGLP